MKNSLCRMLFSLAYKKDKCWSRSDYPLLFSLQLRKSELKSYWKMVKNLEFFTKARPHSLRFDDMKLNLVQWKMVKFLAYDLNIFSNCMFFYFLKFRKKCIQQI